MAFTTEELVKLRAAKLGRGTSVEVPQAEELEVPTPGVEEPVEELVQEPTPEEQLPVGEPLEITEPKELSRFEQFQESRREKKKRSERFEQFQKSRIEKKKRVQRREVETKELRNSTAQILGLDPDKIRSGDEAFKSAISARQEAIESPSILESVQSGLSTVFSGEKVGESVGTGLAEALEKRNVEDLRERLIAKNPKLREMLESETLDITLGRPDSAEVLADIGLVSLDLLTLGKGSEAIAGIKAAGRVAKKAGAQKFLTFIRETVNRVKGSEVFKGAGIGTGIGGLGAIEKGEKRPKEVAKSAAIGAGIGVAAPAVGIIGKIVTPRTRKNIQDEVRDLAAKITQSTKPKDIQKASRSLGEIETTDVKNFKELGDAGQEKINGLIEAIDQEFLKDKRLFKGNGLTVSTKVGEKEVTQNFIEKSLKSMEKVAKNQGDEIEMEILAQLRRKIETTGINTKEINDLSRKFGTEFKNKVFTKSGEIKLSDAAQSFENIRAGLKKTARGKIEGTLAKELDSKIGDLITTKELLENVEESVQKIKNKRAPRGTLEKGLRTIGVFSAAKGLRNLFFESNIGDKTLNFLDLQKELPENLEKLNKLLKKIQAPKPVPVPVTEKVSPIIKKELTSNDKVDIIRGMKKNKIKKIEDSAIETHGTTNDPIEAAFITRDGKFIDGSGRKQGSDGGSRITDHREIAEDGLRSTDEFSELSEGEALVKYQELTENIRVSLDDNTLSLDLITIPTESQIRSLRRMARGADLIIDITDPISGKVKKSGTFDRFIDAIKFIKENTVNIK